MIILNGLEVISHPLLEEGRMCKTGDKIYMNPKDYDSLDRAIERNKKWWWRLWWKIKKILKK